MAQTCYGLNFRQGRVGKSGIVQTVKELMEGEIYSGFVHSARCEEWIETQQQHINGKGPRAAAHHH
ncbi:MAG: hypothetical protein ACFNKE_08315 [Neisseria elongata]